MEPDQHVVAANLLSDRWWRLNHLYKIQDEQGQTVTLELNPAQVRLDDNLHDKNIILKSRQHGITTYACVRGLDLALFCPGTRVGIIAHTKDDASKFFRNKILFAWDNLPSDLRAAIGEKRRDMGGELVLGNGSSIEVGVSLRGGTYQYMFISEYGPMCARFPERASEVKTGALNTLHAGSIAIIESTAYGASGDFHDKCKQAQELDQMVRSDTAELSAMDYRFFFFPWWADERNVLKPDGVRIPPDYELYFEQVEAVNNITLLPPKRAWYYKKSLEQGDKMFREHPSTPDEAFRASVEGAYYGKELARARKDGRILDLPIRTSVRVNTFWDLGWNDKTAIWFHQHVGEWHNFVGYLEDSGESLAYYARKIKEWGDDKNVVFGTHYLPHDAENYDITIGMDRKTKLEELGIKPIKVVPRIARLEDGLEMVRGIFAECRFDATACEQGLDHLSNYQRKWNEAEGRFSEGPLKNEATDGADAFRQFAQGWQKPGKLKPIHNRAKSWRAA